MRIGVIEPMPYGGLLHYATQLADALAQRGNSVELVLASGNELAGREGAACRRAILPPDARAAPVNPTRRQRILRRARTARRLATTWVRIAREVRSGRYDVVLLPGSFDMVLTSGAALMLTHLNGRTPLAHVCHNVRPFNRWGGDALYVTSGPTIRLLKRLYPRFDLVFVHGEQSRQEFEATWPPTHLETIPHGDERLFSDDPPPPSDEARILFFGAWRKMKGLPVLMEAFDQIVQSGSNARLTIAGPPVPEEGEFERVLEWAARHGERIEVVADYVPIEDVRALFARARVVVLPYLAGYQSGVVHLAMTMERAVVVTSVGDLPAVVADGTSGLVVPPREAHALAEALQRVAEDRGLSQRMGAAGHERLRDTSDWMAVAGRVEAGLSQLLEHA
jgi:glycosyltransferase involved in cell wall biosynthesis